MPLTHEWPVVGSREYPTETQAVIDELAEDIDSLDENVTDLTATVSGLSSSVATNSTDIEQLQEDIAGIPTDVEQVANMRLGIFNVLDYGAAGNGITDDRAAVQLAAVALYEAGGGTLKFTGAGKVYKIGYRAGFYGSSMKVGVFLFGSNITIECEPGASILFDEGHANGCAGFVHVNAPGITIDNVDSSGSWWLDHAYFWPSLGGEDGSGLYPTYQMEPAPKGQKFVELSTPADISNVSVGDAIIVRTGQTIDGGGATQAQPDGELNEVAWISSPYVGLAWPLKCDYEQEYFPDNTYNNATSTTPSAYPALFGIQNVEPCAIRNVYAKNCNVIVDQTDGIVWTFNWSTVINTGVIGCTFKLHNGDLGIIASYRNANFDDNRIEMTQDDIPNSWMGSDRCCGDASMSRNYLSAPGDHVGLLHIHEGSYRIKIKNNIILNMPNASGNSAIQVLGRGYDIDIDGNYIEFDSSATGGPILIGGDTYRTRVTNNTLVGSSSRISGTDSVERGNIGAIPQSTPTDSDIHSISKWIYHDSDASEILGDVFAHTFVHECSVLIFEAFNGTSPTIKVGNLGGYAEWFKDSTSLSSQAFDNTRTHPDVQFYQQGGVAKRTAEIVYNAGGSTTGKALVTLKWSWVVQGNGV